MTNRMKRPELGSWHTITEFARKSHKFNGIEWGSVNIGVYLPERGEWIYEGKEDPPPPVSWQNDWKWECESVTECKAMYIGYRYKRNGTFSYDYDNHDFDYYEDFRGFQVRESVEVWMFVTHENRKPIPVFPFGIQQK